MTLYTRSHFSLLVAALACAGLPSTSVASWDLDGTAVCAAEQWQGAPCVVADGYGGVIIAWKDIYDLLEKAVDRCRDAGFVVFHVALKNA